MVIFLGSVRLRLAQPAHFSRCVVSMGTCPSGTPLKMRGGLLKKQFYQTDEKLSTQKEKIILSTHPKRLKGAIPLFLCFRNRAAEDCFLKSL